jgi:hypothetical protein
MLRVPVEKPLELLEGLVARERALGEVPPISGSA